MGSSSENTKKHYFNETVVKYVFTNRKLIYIITSYEVMIGRKYFYLYITYIAGNADGESNSEESDRTAYTCRM